MIAMSKQQQGKKASSSSISGRRDRSPLEFNIGQLLDATLGRVYLQTGGQITAYGGGKFDGHDELLNSPAIDPAFYKDFTTMQVDEEQDSSSSYEPRCRGGEEYFRPYMAKRFGLNLANKYNNLNWLGTNTQNNNRVRSVPGEWPVAYHGTTKKNARSILTEGLRVEFSKLQVYGPGIYCTPDPKTALYYAPAYQHTDGNYYKLFFQARVDPKKREIVKSSMHKRRGHADYWIMADNDSIRTYGLCICKV